MDFGDLKHAFRTLRQAPATALAIVTTIGLGLGLITVVFTLENMMLFRVDQVPNVHEMFAVERPRTADGSRIAPTRAEYEALRRETSVFTDVAAMHPDYESRVDGRNMSGSFVTGNFFQILGVPAALGRTLSPDDDRATGAEPVIVLSHREWTRHFAGDRAVIGRTVLIDRTEYHIVGVMPDGFRGLEVSAATYWAPLNLLQTSLADRGENLVIVGRLKPDMTRQVAAAQLNAWHQARTARAANEKTDTLTLEPRQGTAPQPLEAIMVMTPLFFAFGLILLIGCANVASLLLARAISRQREIGVRLSLGATRGRVIRQLLAESLILALAAAAVGFAVSRLALEGTIFAVTATLPPEVGEALTLPVPGADWRVALFLIAGAILSTVSFGLAPALQATRVELVRAMRGEIIQDARPSRARNILIGVQVGASALLLICAAIFLRSALHSSSVDPGIRFSDTMYVEIVNEPFRTQLVEAVTREPAVAAVAAAWPPAFFAAARPASAEGAQEKAEAAYKFVSPEYFGVMGINVVRGRAFTPEERSAASGVAVVAESFARKLWPDGDPIGEVLRLSPDATEPRGESEPELPARSFIVVGVARDVPRRPLAEVDVPDVYIPITAADAGTSLMVRSHGDPDVARRMLLQRLTAIDPNTGSIMTMKTVIGMQSYLLRIAFWVATALGAVALLLTLSGLFSVLSYLVEQRTKEIGVRMTLGATAADVSRLIVGQTIRPVVIGMAAGALLAIGVSSALIATAGAGTINQIVQLFDPAAYAASLLIIVTACALSALIPTMRATSVEPINTLRQE